MDLGQEKRPAQEIQNTFVIDKEERKQCSVCCAAWSGLIAFCAASVASAPGQWVSMEKHLVTWPRRLDRFLFLPLPIGVVAFTHHYMISSALWSKNKKQIWEINWECTGWNILLWCGLVGAGTVFGRNVLVKYSREYRLRQWEYSRIRRSVSNPYLPQLWGSITENLDYVHFLWWVALYHTIWLGVIMGMDKSMNAHYAMMYRNLNYSKKCSPRWREWREIKMREEVDTKAETGASIGYKRWSSFIQFDPWRVGASTERRY